MTFKCQRSKIDFYNSYEYLFNMYSQEEINDIIANLNDGITVRGNLVAESIMYYGKNIECRKKKIKQKYLALHLGSGKINKELEIHLKNNCENYTDKKLKKGHIVAILKMGQPKFLSEMTEEELKNKWIYSEGGYTAMNYIEKVYILKNSIKSRGFQSMTWNLQCVDNDLKKKEKFEKSLKEKIIEEL